MEQFKLIYIFATVLQYGSMNAAAPHLGMTASAISQAIRKLENHYGVKLLNRTTRSLTPTAEGRQLQQYARQLTDWHDADVYKRQHLCGITAKPYIILNSRKRLTHIIQFPNSSFRRWQVLV